MKEKKRQMKQTLLCMLTILLFFGCILMIPKSTQAATKATATKITKISNKGEVIRIKWKYIKNESYVIYRKAGSGSYKKIKTISEPKQIVYFDTNVKAGTKYSYKIKCKKKVGKKTYTSKYSNVKSTTMVLTDPTIIGFTKNSDSTYTLKWTKIKYAKSYVVYTKTSSGWSKYASTSSTSYKVKSSDASKTFTVQAIGSGSIKSTYGDDKYTKPTTAYTDKSVLIIGDSFTRGSSTLDPGYSDSTYTGSTIATRLGLDLGCDVDATTVSFLTVGTNPSYKDRTLPKTLSADETLCEGYDVICVSVGTNDFKYNVKIGSSSDSSSKSTYYGQLKKSIELIKEQNPDAKIVLFTPTYRMRTERNYYTTMGYSMKNKSGISLDSYCSAMKTVASKTDNVYCYDSKAKNVLNSTTVWSGCNDGLHLSQKYYAKVGDSWAAYLKSLF